MPGEAGFGVFLCYAGRCETMLSGRSQNFQTTGRMAMEDDVQLAVSAVMCLSWFGPFKTQGGAMALDIFWPDDATWGGTFCSARQCDAMRLTSKVLHDATWGG